MYFVTHPLQHFSRPIMSDVLEEHDGKVSIGGRNITNLRFADDMLYSPGSKRRKKLQRSTQRITAISMFYQ